MKKVRGQKKRSHSHASAGSITDVRGLRVGHAHDLQARTGCTVVMCEAEGAIASVDVRGAAPGTRETDLLAPGNLVERVHAVVLTGGSVFGLDAACGVVRYLEERQVGFDTGVARVPIVPAAVIYDLAAGSASVRPDARMGYEACDNASSDSVKEGQVGAGAGATIGKILGPAFSSTGGVGTASIKLGAGVTVGALVVVNAFGDIIDHETGQILSGARALKGRGWLDTSRAIELAFATQGFAAQDNAAHINPAHINGARMNAERSRATAPFSPIENTTLAVVATDAALTKAQAQRVAMMAHDGLARAIRPVHTMFDGDTIFALSTGDLQADVTTIGSLAAELVARAVARVGRMFD